MLDRAWPRAEPLVMRERGRAMLDRVTIEARASLGEGGAALVRDALGSVLLYRDARIEDDHDPRYLHPARTIRILLSDGACDSVAAAAAAAYVDSVDAALSPWPDAPQRKGPDQVPVLSHGADHHARVLEILGGVPRPAGEAGETLERLVTAPAESALVALCEWLDQARHVHMRQDVAWESTLEQVRTAYAPAARRIAPQVARRFEHWADAFERRLLLRRRSADLP